MLKWFTIKKDTPLAITTADCIPIIIYDPKNKVIANIHSGWKGSLNKIVINAIEKLQDEFSSNVNDLLFFFGPAICHDCFEVEEDVKQMFYDKFSYLENIKDIKIDLLAIDNNIVIAHWYLEQNDDIFDGIYEIKFNKKLECIYFKSWEMTRKKGNM